MNSDPLRQRIIITSIFVLILALNAFSLSTERMSVFELFRKYDYVAFIIFFLLYVGLGEYSFFIKKSLIPKLLFFLLTVIAIFCSLPLLKEQSFIDYVSY